MLRSLMVLAGFGSSTKRRMVSILALALAWVGSFAVRIAPIDEIFQGLGFPKDYQEFVKKFCGQLIDSKYIQNQTIYHQKVLTLISKDMGLVL